MGYFTMILQETINKMHKRIPDTLEQFSELIDPDLNLNGYSRP